jgi:hypothetical protein
MSYAVTKKTAKPVLGFKGLTPEEKISRQEAVVTAVQSSAVLKSSPVLKNSLRAWTATTDDLRRSLKNVLAAERNLATQRADLAQELEAFERAATVYANNVDNAASGDPEIVKELGLSIRGQKATREGNGSLEPPGQIVVKPGKNPGEVSVSWKRVNRARVFNVETAPSDGGPWTKAASVTRTRNLLKGLPAGQKVWVRVTSVGAKGESVPSSPVAGQVR